MKYSHRQIAESIGYWKDVLRRMDEARIQPMPRKWNAYDIKPFSKKELDDIIRELGETNNFQDAGWIFPDGRMPDMGRAEETYWKNDRQYYYADNREVDVSRRYEHECLPLSDERHKDIESIEKYFSPAEYMLNAGFIRIDGAESACVHCLTRPTSQQMDRLYDFVNQPWEEMRDLYRHRKGITEFSLDLRDKAIRYEDADEFRKRLINDIRNFT